MVLVNIICLQSDPKRVANVKYHQVPFLNKFKFEIFEAIEGNTEELPKFMDIYDIDISENYRNRALRGQVACSCSHYALWKKMLDNDISNMVIMEDDAILDEGFENHVEKILDELPSDW